MASSGPSQETGSKDLPVTAVQPRPHLSRDLPTSLREVSTTGNIQTVAGDGIPTYSGDGGSAVETSLDPISVRVNSAGDLFIADYINNRVRQVSRGIASVILFRITSSHPGKGLSMEAGTEPSLIFSSNP
jgi:hypothetical protein